MYSLYIIYTHICHIEMPCRARNLLVSEHIRVHCKYHLSSPHLSHAIFSYSQALYYHCSVRVFVLLFLGLVKTLVQLAVFTHYTFLVQIPQWLTDWLTYLTQTGRNWYEKANPTVIRSMLVSWRVHDTDFLYDKLLPVPVFFLSHRIIFVLLGMIVFVQERGNSLHAGIVSRVV